MLTCFWIKNQILFFKQLWPKNRKTINTLLLAQTDRFRFKLGKKVTCSTTQRLSWQSLASRKTRLETWFPILENFRIESRVEFHNSRVGSFEFRVERNNELAGWMSFRKANWIREVLSFDVEGLRQNTDPRSTDPLLTPYWPLYWPPIKSRGKWKLKKPRTINGTRFKFINKLSLPETSKMADALQISDSCSPLLFSGGFVDGKSSTE